MQLHTPALSLRHPRCVAYNTYYGYTQLMGLICCYSLLETYHSPVQERPASGWFPGIVVRREHWDSIPRSPVHRKPPGSDSSTKE